MNASELSARRGPFGKTRVMVDPVGAICVLHDSIGATWLASLKLLRPCAPHWFELPNPAVVQLGGLSSAVVTSSDAAPAARGIISTTIAAAASAAPSRFPIVFPPVLGQSTAVPFVSDDPVLAVISPPNLERFRA